ncbi:TonB-dependent receptor [Vibrio sp. La 4.2.2]|uniref:TonB-dependent receptor n=1 Tax=Vibrio sp. La 4.2.2 TaxID=2998830 RepID=UPI0022CE2C8D|nr:TonB-dependent receptor [Vibrio sp. La 4.2.2]MDA0108569.1 TonB-dependent receptor [Vibrio sp. La 4.2.2]
MKISSRKFPLNAILATMIVSGVSASAVAETESSNTATNTDEKMVVVASRTPKSISEIPGTVWYVGTEEIEEQYRAGKNLDEILAATVPSLDVNSGGRTHSGQNLRGRSIMVMIDGVSLQSVRSISRQLDSIDPFNIERIEVLSGATSVYGAGSSGGVINIVTKKAQSNDLQFESFVGGTSGFNSSEDGDYKLAQSVSGGNDKVRGRASVAYNKTQAYYDANGKMVTPDITQGSTQFNETVDLLGNMQISLTDTQDLNLLAQYYNSQQDSPYGLYFEKDNSGVYKFVDVRKGYEADRQQGTERYMLSAQYTNQSFLNHLLIAELSYRKEDHTFSPYTQDGGTSLKLSSSNQNTDIFALKTALSKSFDKLQLTYGVDGFIDRFSSDQALYNQTITENTGGLVNKIDSIQGRYPGIDTYALAGFVQAEYALTTDWTLQGGYRYQYMNTKVDDFKKNASTALVPGGETDYSANLFNLGTIYHLDQTSQVWANFSQGFDLANPAKYYGKDPSVNVNDTKLDGIRTNSYEVGYRSDWDKVSLQTAAYYSYSDGSVEYSADQSIKGISNPIRIYGAEAQLTYWATNNLQLGATGHYVVSEEKADSGWEAYKAMEASVPKASAWLGWYEDNYNVKLQSLSTFDYKDADDRKLEGYTVVDLMGSYKLPVGSLGFGIKNLFNADYQTTWSQRATYWYSGTPALYDYKGRGRTFTLNYQVKY